MKPARRADLAPGLKVHRDAKGIFGLRAERPQVVGRREQSKDSLRPDAANKVRQVGLVVLTAAEEMVWGLQREHRDEPLQEQM